MLWKRRSAMRAGASHFRGGDRDRPRRAATPEPVEKGHAPERRPSGTARNHLVSRASAEMSQGNGPSAGPELVFRAYLPPICSAGHDGSRREAESRTSIPISVYPPISLTPVSAGTPRVGGGIGGSGSDRDQGTSGLARHGVNAFPSRGPPRARASSSGGASAKRSERSRPEA